MLDKLKEKARGLKARIIFPEGSETRILDAIKELKKYGVVNPILIGNKLEVKSKLGFDVEVIDPKKSEKLEEYKKIYSGPKEITDPLVFSAIAVRNGDADAMIAGATYSTADVIITSKKIIGLKKSVASSFFIMDIPGFLGGEDGCLVYADAAVVPNPNAEQMAEIAITTGESVANLLGWKPRIAMLSFSTKGSANTLEVQKVVEATKLAKNKGFEVDGEMQVDAALVMSVAQKKMKEVGSVGGRANVLIFPNLDAGNIAYKLTQRLANAKAYGPILQGFNKPVSDLSRGATVEDIMGSIVIISILTKSLN